MRYGQNKTIINSKISVTFKIEDVLCRERSHLKLTHSCPREWKKRILKKDLRKDSSDDDLLFLKKYKISKN